ncbi:hypothetical protein ACQEVB_09970 [Pseudonocardia sp. CA-107938]|uniref:hypothetical protein n=1 Tax=Pseudonocardia sp. CA-107938 TaxID=3240021 RepID=UPI003D8C8CD8
MRIPVVTGLGHGTGASTVAEALHARDAGTWAPAADIVVCRGGGGSMRAAEALRLAPFGLRPVLALTHTGAAPAASRARVQQLGRRFAAVVELPYVARWEVLGQSPAEAADLLGLEREELEPAVAAYAAALRRLVDEVLGGGQLAEPVPPVLIRSSGPEPETELVAALTAAGHPAMRLDDRAG